MQLPLPTKGVSKVAFTKAIGLPFATCCHIYWIRASARNGKSNSQQDVVDGRKTTYCVAQANVRIPCHQGTGGCADTWAPNRFHASGIPRVFGDCRVRFATDEIEFAVMQRVATINGDENLEDLIRSMLAQDW